MSDLRRNINADDFNQTHLNFNHSTNGTSNPNNTGFTASNEIIIRILFIAIATITVLICLTVCICICLKRRNKSKHRKNKDQLLPDLSNKTSTNNPINGKQGSLIQQTSLSSCKTPIKSFYYDNLDDIPFIDESRPTSVVDITKV